MNKYTLGVDVSHWEGMIDWSLASQFIPFAYYKCTEGLNYVDDLFRANKQGCQEAGIPHSCYHYYKTSCDPVRQAKAFYQASGGDYPVMILDVEEAPKDGSKDHFMDDLWKFITTLHLQPHAPHVAIYTSPGFWNDWVTHPTPGWAWNMDLLVAHYTLNISPSMPHGFKDWKVWQFTDKFYFPGCYETADGNWFNGSLAEMRKWFGNYRPFYPPQQLRLRSLFNALHIRAEPEMQAKEVGHLVRGEVIELQELGGRDAWVKHARGWTAIEHEGYRYLEVLNER
jgi:lysozyme